MKDSLSNDRIDQNVGIIKYVLILNHFILILCYLGLSSIL